MKNYDKYLSELQEGKKWVNKVNPNYFAEITAIKTTNMDYGVDWIIKFNMRDKTKLGRVIDVREEYIDEFLSNWRTIQEKVQLDYKFNESFSRVLFSNLGITITNCDGSYKPVYQILEEISVEWNRISEEAKPWKPNYGEKYFTIVTFSNPKIYEETCENNREDDNRLELNLIFKTKEEAEARRKEIVEFLKGE